MQVVKEGVDRRRAAPLLKETMVACCSQPSWRLVRQNRWSVAVWIQWCYLLVKVSIHQAHEALPAWFVDGTVNDAATCESRVHRLCHTHDAISGLCKGSATSYACGDCLQLPCLQLWADLLTLS